MTVGIGHCHMSTSALIIIVPIVTTPDLDGRFGLQRDR